MLTCLYFLINNHNNKLIFNKFKKWLFIILSNECILNKIVYLPDSECFKRMQLLYNVAFRFFSLRIQDTLLNPKIIEYMLRGLTVIVLYANCI